MRKPRVIIYDDDAIIISVLVHFFSKRGYEVYSFNGPVVCPIYESLTDRCENSFPCADVMISDFEMPKMTGIELLERQAERGCKLDKRMKAIMSGYSDDELVAQCEALGYKFFQKPFTLAELSAWLNGCERHFDLSQQLTNKRVSRRNAFKQDIEYCLNSVSEEKFVATTFDKSSNGLGLRIAEALRVGDKIKIVRGLEVPYSEGVVKWCSKQGENTYRAGLCLLHS